VAKKYYWLKLKRDFFKRHDIRIIEEMENGKDYILFYLKLLVESIDHEGALRFSDTIPYNEKMISTITNTNIDIVRAAMTIFLELGFAEILNDKTIYLSQVSEMIGSETEWAKKKREYRTLEGQKKTMSDKSKSKSLEIELEKELDIEKEEKPKKHRYGEYKHVLLTDEEYEKLNDKLKNRDEMIKRLDEGIERKGYKYKNYYLAVLKWAEKDGLKQPKKMTEKDYAEGWE
jgi:predicted phage replisome organizer